jgi:hypothetical protein
MVVDRTGVTQDLLSTIYDGTFDNNNGEEDWRGAAVGVSRLAPWENCRFERYTLEQYQADIKALAEDTNQCRTGMITPDDAVDINTLLAQMDSVITVNNII